jgi:hypothetical protein
MPDSDTVCLFPEQSSGLVPSTIRAEGWKFFNILELVAGAEIDPSRQRREAGVEESQVNFTPRTTVEYRLSSFRISRRSQCQAIDSSLDFEFVGGLETLEKCPNRISPPLVR